MHDDGSLQTCAEAKRALQELQIHQIELEMQNLELRQVRDKLETSLEKYTDLYDFAPVGYFTLDQGGSVRAVNLTGASLLSIERSRLLGRRFEQLVSAADRAIFSEYLRNISENGASNVCEVELLKDGRHPFSVQLKAKISVSGEEYRIAAIDISERKRNEHDLRISENRLADAQKLGHLGNWQWDAIEDKITGSDEFYRIFGCQFTSFDGFLKLVHPDDRDMAKLAVLATRKHQVPYNDFYRIIRPDGTIRIILAKGEAVADNTGKIVRMFGTILDVTERRQLEGKLESLNNDLVARAVELTAANSELEAFSYTVSHDLRRPLTIINSYCQEIQDMYGDMLDDQFRKYIQEMYKCTLRMSGLIDTLLNFSGVTSVDMRLEPIDLSAIATEVAANLKLLKPERQVLFKIDQGIAAVCDAGLMEIVLDNLIGNAWKYTGNQKEALIEFGVTDVNGTPAYYCRDNGTGFDVENAENLFIPFQRLPGPEEFRGHGIGLATVQRVIHRHGGRIWAIGDAGRGACFYFTLAADCN